MIKVLLADDHAAVAEGIAALLKDVFQIVGIVHDGRALLEAADRLQPDVIITDITMPLLNGVSAIHQLTSSRPRSKIIVLTMHADRELAVEAFRAGAAGYLLKTASGEEIIAAVREVMQGHAYVCSLLTKDLISFLIETRSNTAAGPALTPRQREVLQLIAEGQTMKEVAARLNISPRTAESHKYDMMQQLGVQTTAELIQHAIRLKLITV